MPTDTLKFDWDEQKSQSNLIKHGFDFTVARTVFDDPRVVVIFDRFVTIPDSVFGEAREEGRWHAYGLLGGTDVVAMVVHTHRYDDGAEVIRIISARFASRKERKIYEKETL